MKKSKKSFSALYLDLFGQPRVDMNPFESNGSLQDAANLAGDWQEVGDNLKSVIAAYGIQQKRDLLNNDIK